MDCTPFAGSPESWNEAVSALGVTHALQSYEWGELKREIGWEPRRFLFHENERTIAAASVLRRRVLAGMHVLYAPKGPAYDPASAHRLPEICAHLARIASGPCLFLKIDPDIEQGDGAALSALRASGFRPSAEQVQFRNTMLIDLRRDEDDLRRRMRREVRYYLNVARRSGVEVASRGMADLPVFYRAVALSSAAPPSAALRALLRAIEHPYIDRTARNNAIIGLAQVASRSGAPLPTLPTEEPVTLDGKLSAIKGWLSKAWPGLVRADAEKILAALGSDDPLRRMVGRVWLEACAEHNFGFSEAADPQTRALSVQKARAWLTQGTNP